MGNILECLPNFALPNLCNVTVKHCSKCDAGFECKADSTGCWCEAYTVEAVNLGVLREQFADCLCPDCLALYGKLKGNAEDAAETET